MAESVESVDVTADLRPLLGGEGDNYRILFVLEAGGLDDAALVPLFREIRATGSEKASALIVALRTALAHQSRLEDIAARAELDPESLLELLTSELARGPIGDLSGSSFSTSELSALRAANVDLSGPPPSTSAAVATASAYARMVAAALTVDECASLLGVTPGRVRQRVTDRSLHAIRSRVRGEWRLPRWQFDDKGPVAGLEAVLPRLPESLHPLAVEHFMTAPVPDLDVNDTELSPLQWLQSGGDPRAVVDLAVGLPAAS